MITSRLLPQDKLVDAFPERVIFHWTAGGGEANSDDLNHYHLVIERNGNPVFGFNTIADNDSTRDRRYAAHTRMLNTKSIGVAVAGMAGSQERPFDPGSSPITHGQYEMACRAIAELCERYGIPVTEKTVLNHGEVETVLGVAQRGKWDVMVLPWAPGLSWEQVGKKFRERVSYYLWELTRMKDREPEAVAAPAARELVAVVTAQSGLRLRKGPGTRNPVLTVLPYGSEVNIEDDVSVAEPEWALVSTRVLDRGRYYRGYVHTDWLELPDWEPKG